MIEYLGRYIHKIAISIYRIRQIDKEKRTEIFSLKDYRKGGKKTTQTLSTKEFIRRFALHILPKGFTRIRHNGILSSTWKTRLPARQEERLPNLQQTLSGKKPTCQTENPREKVPVNTLLHTCPSYKEGILITLLVFDKRGPPENYNEIIRNAS